MNTNDKRKRVMSRSIKLGHCVCDPRKPCPCPLLKEKNICTCAGERVPPDHPEEKVRLTRFVRSAGCASKISQKDLHQVLQSLPVVSDPRLLVGTATADDAGVFRISDNLTVVQTVDVFTPGVDDPHLFGRIAACNSLSDIYAMGGTPVTALSVIGFPIYSLPHEVMADILRGGMEVLKEAGTILLGGHSINDEEIKFGFAVTGVIDPARIITNAGARPGDILVLTKPLGTGIISLAAQMDKASAPALEAAIQSMSSLNRVASEIMIRHGATACTDVTGFGLLGHLCRMVIESRVEAELWFNAVPLFPEVLNYARQGIFSGANERNAEFSAARTTFEDTVTEDMKAILYDAQTSGGLLIAVPADRADRLLADLQDAGVTAACRIGRMAAASEGTIHVKIGSTPSQTPARQAKHSDLNEDKEKPVKKENNSEEAECCAHSSSTPDKALGMFRDFMGTAMQPGAVDVVTKELMAIALGLAVNCVPCSRIHIKKAVSMGIGKAEIEEAAALAVAFAGCRALMLWNQLKQELLS